ncbi:G-PROTEIN-RECEP-F1-2 domain-containing protein [Aphelenchoides bicaudatus]|nr:G-PROTEIN-RECEP-F1-2 domain-containing protein [Aphelenchoides bicaudatus]
MLTALYGVVYELLAMTLCLSGIGGHCFSIILLSRMSNPTNLLLISMSVSQLILCVNFLFSTLHKYGSSELCLSWLSSYFWTWIFLVSVNLSVIVHIIGVFHVTALSIIRYLSLRQLSNMTSNAVWFTYQKCIRTIALIYVSVLLLCGPIYFHSNVSKTDSPDPHCVEKYPHQANKTIYQLSFSKNENLHKINFWWFSIICKLAPCVVLFIMSILILKQLKAIQAMSSRFTNQEKTNQHNRTTKIILIVMIVFICVELPQGILNILQSQFELPYLDVIWDFFELCTLLTSCIIFGLFLTMNSRLREAFLEVVSKNLAKFRPCCAPRTPDSCKEHLFDASSTELCRLTSEQNSRSIPNYEKHHRLLTRNAS